MKRATLAESLIALGFLLEMNPKTTQKRVHPPLRNVETVIHGCRGARVLFAGCMEQLYGSYHSR